MGELYDLFGGVVFFAILVWSILLPCLALRLRPLIALPATAALYALLLWYYMETTDSIFLSVFGSLILGVTMGLVFLVALILYGVRRWLHNKSAPPPDDYNKEL